MDYNVNIFGDKVLSRDHEPQVDNHSSRKITGIMWKEK